MKQPNNNKILFSLRGFMLSYSETYLILCTRIIRLFLTITSAGGEGEAVGNLKDDVVEGGMGNVKA